MSLSVVQPVILLGYPTNGYLSLNNRMYRYTQYEEDELDPLPRALLRLRAFPTLGPTWIEFAAIFAWMPPRLSPTSASDPRDSIIVNPAIEITPLQVDLARAIELGVTLRPQLQAVQITGGRRK